MSYTLEVRVNFVQLGIFWIEASLKLQFKNNQIVKCTLQTSVIQYSLFKLIFNSFNVRVYTVSFIHKEYEYIYFFRTELSLIGINLFIGSVQGWCLLFARSDRSLKLCNSLFEQSSAIFSLWQQVLKFYLV